MTCEPRNLEELKENHDIMFHFFSNHLLIMSPVLEPHLGLREALADVV